MASVRSVVAALLGLSAYAANANTALPSLDSAQVEDMRKLYGGQIQPLPTTKTRWHLSDLEAAEHAADTGDISQAARLMRTVRKDGLFSGVLSTRTGGLVRLPKRFRGRPEIVEELELGHDSVRSVFDEMFPPSELSSLAADGILLGVGVAELVPVQGRNYPVLVRLDPEFLSYRWNENRWYYASVVGLLPITPGDGRWVLHTPGGRIAPWQNGLWRAVARAWIDKEHARLHKSNWEAKLANPARVAVSPQGAAEQQKQSWFRAVMAWGVNTVFGVSPGYDVKLLESNGVGYQCFNTTIELSNRDMIVAIAGQEVTTDGGAGFSNADIHKSIRADLIKDTADGLAYTLNTQGIPPYVCAVWGPESLDQSACVEWDVAPAKDRASEAAAMQISAQAMQQLATTLEMFGRTLDVDSFAVKFGIPLGAVVKTEATVAAPAKAKIELAPTDVAAVVTVDESRAQYGFPQWETSDQGKLSVSAFRALSSASGEAVGEAVGESGTELAA